MILSSAARWRGLSLAMLAFIGSCRSQPALSPSANAQPEAEESARKAPAAAARLGILLVFDQLGSDVLLRYWDLLSDDGAIKTTQRRGVYFERSRYPYANTLTAVGHATLATGALPSVHGVYANEVWDPQAGQAVPAVRDPEGRVLGRKDAWAGPVRLRVQTLAESLKRSTAGRGRVVSLSLKDRSAVFSVGSAGDAVLFFDRGRGKFTSSLRYGSVLPAWVTAFEQARPVASLFTPWTPKDPDVYREWLGPDDAPGEGFISGDSSFPHSGALGSTPYRQLLAFPQLSLHLVQLAERAVSAHALGSDDVPDLLVLSISGTDYAGHLFGPDSWEYVDHLVRADEALGSWLSRLEQQTTVALSITSDHGAAPLPERDLTRARFDVPVMAQGIERALSADLGPGPWVRKLQGPMLYLHPKPRSTAKDARERIRQRLQRDPLVAAAVDISDAGLAATNPTETVSRRALVESVRRSVPAQNGADFYLIYRRNVVANRLSANGRGTHHGTPYAYDSVVPLLFRAPGLEPRRVHSRVSQLQVAPTLAALLGVPPPTSAQAPPLLR